MTALGPSSKNELHADSQPVIYIAPEMIAELYTPEPSARSSVG